MKQCWGYHSEEWGKLLGIEAFKVRNKANYWGMSPDFIADCLFFVCTIILVKIARNRPNSDMTLEEPKELIILSPCIWLEWYSDWPPLPVIKSDILPDSPPPLLVSSDKWTAPYWNTGWIGLYTVQDLKVARVDRFCWFIIFIWCRSSLERNGKFDETDCRGKVPSAGHGRCEPSLHLRLLHGVPWNHVLPSLCGGC